MVGVLAVATALASCSETGGRPPSGAPGPGEVVPIAALVAVEGCDAYLEWIRAEALERVGPWGLGGGPIMMEDGMADTATDEMSAAPVAGDDTSASARSTAPTAGAEAAATGTNNQEAGVDEADQVKTDGRRLVAVRDQSLRVVDLDGPTEAATIPLGVAGARIFLRGDRVLAFGESYEDRPIDGATRDIASAPGVTEVIEVDLAAGQVVGRQSVPGFVVDGRMSGDVVRLVTTASPPELGFVYPRSPGGEESATRLNRQLVVDSTIEDWLPHLPGEAPVVDCARLYRPAEFAGFSTTSVLSFPEGLESMAVTSLAADTDTVYASPTGLVAATTRYPNWDEQGRPDQPTTHTDLHRFDTSVAGPAVYQASGRVAGRTIGSYALSEHDGHLRVATTTDAGVGGFCGGPAGDCAVAEAPASSSQVTVLTVRGDRLVETGRVEGLGPTEEIQGVRFMGDRGYVVTFRRTDPLYVLDLADPASPRVLGELKVTGFSDYLHPVGAGRLLGVGVEADLNGVTTGAKVSLYDTSDPTRPTELDKVVLPGWLEPGSDPHAFTWDADTATAVMSGSWFGAGGDSTAGALAVRVDGDTLVEVARLSHPGGDGSPGIERTLVAADRLWAVSWTGLSGHDRGDLRQVAWLPWTAG